MRVRVGVGVGVRVRVRLSVGVSDGRTWEMWILNTGISGFPCVGSWSYSLTGWISFEEVSGPRFTRKDVATREMAPATIMMKVCQP